MEREIARERLGRVLRRRHQVDVIALDAPVGYGKSTLLRQAIAAGPADRANRDVTSSPGEADDLVSTIAGLLASPGELALFLDDVEPNGAGHRACVTLLSDLPAHLHLVIAGDDLSELPLTRLLASGRALRLSAKDLAFDDHELDELTSHDVLLDERDRELLSWPAVATLVLQGEERRIPVFLRDVYLASVDAGVRTALAAVAVTGGGPWTVARAAVAAVGVDPDAVVDRLAVVPLVDQTTEGCWPHHEWASVAHSVLGADRVSLALRAASTAWLERWMLPEAAAAAIKARDDRTLRCVVRAALQSQPPRVPPALLQAWVASGVLDPQSAEAEWLGGVVDLWGRSRGGIDRLEVARSRFADAEDQDSELAVIFHLGSALRETGDGAGLVRVVARCHELAAAGARSAAALAALASAVETQLRGDFVAAVETIDRSPASSLSGDWAAQVLMIRGTNLALAGRQREAFEDLEAATGIGSTTSRSVAHQLVSNVHWGRGDFDAALDHARIADVLAAGAPVRQARVRATIAVLSALHHGGSAAEVEITRARPDARLDTEASLLCDLAAAVVRIDAGDLEGARRRLESMAEPVPRAVPSTFVRAALETALTPSRRDAWCDLARTHRALLPSIEAGTAAAEHLRGGPSVAGRGSSYLPRAWRAGVQTTLDIQLADWTIRRNGVPLDHPAWNRSRVREVLAHLVLRPDCSRGDLAADIWPDASRTASSANLRVTLTHLADVLSPDRPAGTLGPLLVDDAGRLRLVERTADVVLRVDVRQWQEDSRRIIDAAWAGAEPRALARGQRLLTSAPGPIVDRSTLGDWAERPLRALEDLVLRAGATAGALAVAGGDFELADRLGRLILEVDQWSETGHRFVVGAALERGDVDGARRATRAALDALAVLGVTPSHELLELARRAGFRRLMHSYPE